MTRADGLRLDVVEADRWDSLVDDADGATPFIRSAWLDLAARATGGQSQLIGAWDGDHLVAGAAGVVAGSGWRQRLATPALLPHSGIIFRPPVTQRLPNIESERVGAASALIEHLQSRFARIQLTHAPEVIDARPFQWAGWQVTPRFTYLIDLPEDRSQVWDGFERRTRTAIRKAEKTGCRVESTTDADELRRLYEAIYGGDTSAPVPSQVMHSMAQSAVTAGLVEGWRCLAPSGATASVVFFVQHGATLYAWVAGADPALRDTGATPLLYWHVLQHTRATRFDFVGANLPAIAMFKRGFGGRLVPYFATEGFGSPWLRTATGIRRALRR